MKKLKLSLSNMEGVEVLTREQLKKVIGGEDGSGDWGGGSGDLKCSTSWCGRKFEGSLIGSGKWVDKYCKTMPRLGIMPPSCGCEVATSVNCTVS